VKNVVILGSSGSIGQNALWVISRYPEEFNIYGLSVYGDTETLLSQIKSYKPISVCVSDEKKAMKFRSSLPGGVELLSGAGGLEDLASRPEVDIVVNGVVGFAGLRATLAAAAAGKRIALANKESMVAGGELVAKAVTVGGAELIPVDSEHSAIFQCLKAGDPKEVRRLILTSSGGPFRNLPQEKFSGITVEQALRHPTWKMGDKITIDSATLMNKGLEIIEAAYLFDLPQRKIEVIIHPQSIVHSMVEFVDGAIIAQLSRPDMRLPIQYALFYPRRQDLNQADIDFSKNLTLEFEPPDPVKFPSLALARGALDNGGTAPVVFNASNEIAVAAFLRRRIKFVDIFRVVEKSLHDSPAMDIEGIDSVIAADTEGRRLAGNIIDNLGYG
jgi:1-deoxy-D-xylulose-5-phosphate reductoisomerase